MTHVDFLKKFKFLKPQEPTPAVLGCFVFSLCLIFSLFLLDYRILNGHLQLLTWFKSNASIPQSTGVGFLEIGGENCDIFRGNWVWDETYPLYQSKDCMFLDNGFRCSENGRPDNFYTKWRWQPKDCNLPRSCESTSSLTAKLILVDGQLQEFLWPVKVSLLLPQDSDCFICSAEEMEFGDFAAAMGGDEVLQAGEIYFELPMAWRNVRLQAEDMAALALKASVALASKSRDDDDDDRIINCCCCYPSRQAKPVALFCEKEMPLLAGEGGQRRRGKGGVMAGRKFVTKLSAIVED